jgi:hypothetical protein
MRALFLLLVLANLAFFAWASITREGAGGNPNARLEIAPESIKLLKAAGQVVSDRPDQSKAKPGKPVPPTPGKSAAAAPSACMEWGIFAGPAVAKAEAALARLEIAPERIERAVADAGGYWVYMPPLKTKADADRKLAELKDLGVTEYFIVQEPAKWRLAISLGIFRTEEAAQAFLLKIRERGVRSAVAARRENFLKQVAFFVREPGDSTVARLTLIQQEFPGSELKAGPCPVAAVAAKG